MTPTITAGVLAGAMVRGLCQASSGDSRWESSFHHGGTAVTGPAGIPGMVTVTGMDTPGLMDTGMAGIMGIIITHIMDRDMGMGVTTSITGVITLVTGMHTPAPIGRLTSADRSMVRQKFHAEQDRIGTSRDPGRRSINARSRTCTNDRKTRAGIQGHPVMRDRSNVRVRTPINDTKVRPGTQCHLVIQDQGKT